MQVGVVYAPRQNWPKWEWVANALTNLGHDVVRVTHADQLMDADARCEVLLFEHRDCGIGWRHVRDRAGRRKAFWAQWWFDLVATQANQTLSQQPQFRLCGSAMRLFDAVFVKESALLGEYRELGVPAYYLDQGCPSHWKVCEPNPVWDVLVFGSADAGYRARHRIVRELVSEGFSVAWATDQGQPPNGVERLPWCHPDRLSELMGQARCVLCVDYRSDVAGYVSDRNWLVAGAGALPVMSVNDVRRVCSMSDADREALGAQLRKRTLESNTYEHRLQRAFAIIDGIRRGAVGETSLPRVQGDEASHSHGRRQANEGVLSGV